MKTQLKTWMLAVTALTMIAGTALEAQACGGSGPQRGGFGLNRGGYGSPSYSSYQPVSSYRTAPANYAVPNQYGSSSYQPAPTQYSSRTSSFAPAQVSTQVARSAPSQFAPQNQQTVSPQFSQSSQPVRNQQRTNSIAQNSRGQTQQRSATPTRNATTQSTGLSAQSALATNQNASSEASALAMLASINQSAAVNQAVASGSSSAIPEFGSTAASATTQTPAAHVGKWSVTLPGSQSVTLDLNQDGTFAWTATKGGSTSRFLGQYELGSDQLVLKRASDSSKMEGTWTPSNSGGFVFRVGSGTTGGLSFTKS